MASRVKRLFSQRNGKTEQPASPKAIAPTNGTLKTEPAVKANGTAPGKVIPSFDELPKFHEFNGCAWEVWGKDDELGTINLLTEDVVGRAAREEIRYVTSAIAFDVELLAYIGVMPSFRTLSSGRAVSLNWCVVGYQRNVARVGRSRLT